MDNLNPDKEKWRHRVKLINKTNVEAAVKYILKHQHEYEQKLLVDEHYKDGYVVYYENNPKEENQ